MNFGETQINYCDEN